MTNNQLSIVYEGAIWNLNSEICNTILKYASIIEEVPQLNTFINGFLLSDYLIAFRSYFWTYLFFYTLMSLNKAFALVFLSFFFFITTIFFSKSSKQYVLDKSSPYLRTALLLYITYHRIEVFMSFRKGYLAITILLFIFIFLPKFIAAMIFPIAFSSILVKTEMLVNYMRFM